MFSLESATSAYLHQTSFKPFTKIKAKLMIGSFVIPSCMHKQYVFGIYMLLVNKLA